MPDIDDVVAQLTAAVGAEKHSATDSSGWVALQTGAETTVRLSPSTGLDATTRGNLEAALTEALDLLLHQDSPATRELLAYLSQETDFDETRARMREQATSWHEQSQRLQERIARVRERRA